jgi:dynein heavy chain 1
MVQAKINNKYDAWHKELLSYFGTTFGDKLRNFYRKISEERKKLEKINFSNISSDIMDGIATM